MIRFPLDQGDKFTLIHRLRNYGEDLFSFLRERADGWGQVDLAEIDAATSEFSIHGVPRSKLRSLIRIVEEEAGRHRLRIIVEAG